MDGGVRLEIHTEEKQSWIAAPTLYFLPGNVGGGAGFLESNLGGLNKKLAIYGQIASADTFALVAFLDPSIAGSRAYLRGDAVARHYDTTEYDTDDHAVRTGTMTYYNAGLLVGLNLIHDWSIDSRLRVGHVAFTDVAWARASTAPPPPAPQVDGWDVSEEIRLTRDGRSSWNGVTDGIFAQLLLEHAVPFLGSAYDYYDGQIKLAFAKRLFDNHNLTFRPSLGAGAHLPWDQEFTAGGVNLRGYSVAEYRGDFRAAAQLEYSVELFWWKQLAFRALGFWDTAYTAFLNPDDGGQRNYLPEELGSGRERWRNGVGAGFRLYFSSIVLPLVGIDVGYGLETRGVNLYFAIGVTEL
jgi:outer membrane protein assembly factor BamA